MAFFGTPDIAATILKAILRADTDEVVRVVCQPDRPKGRGRKTEPPPVKQVAEEARLAVRQPTRLKDGALARELRDAGVDLGVVVAYGRILPPALFEAPRFGTVNVHASVLPRHRGAAPIQHAILAGDAETGVTLMKLSEGMDEGAMLHVRTTPIRPEDTSGTLFARLAELGAACLVEGLELAKRQGLEEVPQDPSRATYAPMLSKTDGRLDLRESAQALDRRCRAVHPWPGAYLDRPGAPLKIHRAVPVPADALDPGHSATPGTVLAAEGDRLRIACGDGALDLLEVQVPGKRPMPAADFLRGAGRTLEVGRSIWSAPD